MIAFTLANALVWLLGFIYLESRINKLEELHFLINRRTLEKELEKEWQK